MLLRKCCTQYASKFGKLSSGHRIGNGPFSFQSLRKAMSKNAQTATQLHSSHTLAKECSKFSKPGFNSTWTMSFQMFKLVLEKAEEPEINIANICWIIEKAREFQKNIYFCFIDSSKAFDCVDHNMENFERPGNSRPPDLPLEKPVCRSGSNSYNWTWNNKLVPNRKRSKSRLYIVTLII